MKKINTYLAKPALSQFLGSFTHRKKRTTLFLFLLLFCGKLFAQDPYLKEKLPSFVPPSPNIASLGKFGDIPVGLYTGVPQISIPLYSINIKDFSLPISLSYHASGVKVNEYAPSTGMGWALSGGGVISVAVKGLPDNEASGFLYNNALAAKKANRYVKNQMGASEKSTYEFDASKGTIDTEPDLYSFNIGSLSGKFMIDSNGVAVPIPYQNIKIEQINDYFVVTDTKGNKYFLSELEGTLSTEFFSTNGNVVNNLDPKTSYSWHLTKIVLYNGDEINFTYVVHTITPSYQIAESKYFLKEELIGCSMGAVPFENLISYNSWNETQIAQKKISKITFPNGKVEFYYDTTDRDDLEGDYALKDVKIFNYESSNYHLINSYAMSYVYGSNRMFLDKIVEKGSDGYGQKGHEFVYNNKDLLPSKDSKSIDFWGFYNGAPNTTLIPSTIAIEPIFTSGANRETNQALLKYGSLEKITYPTKGFTIFDFEPHDYGNIRGVNVLDSNYSVTNEFSFINVPVTTSPVSQTFTIQYRQAVVVESTVNGNGIYAELRGPGDVPIYSNNGLLSTQQTKVIILNPGVYTLKGNNYESSFTCIISVSFKSRIATGVSKNRTAGGLRINNIKNYNADGTLLNSKFYKYKLQTDNTRSSGVLVNSYFDEYFKIVSKVTNCVGQNGAGLTFTALANYLVRNSYSSFPLVSGTGSHIVYSEIEEFDNENGTNGKSISEFVSPKDVGDLVFETFPYRNAVSNDYQRGMLKQKTEFRFENGIFKKDQRLKYNYSAFGDAYGGMPGAIIGVVYDFISNPIDNTYSAHTYRLIGPRINLTSAQQISYFSSSTDSVVVNKSYLYESNSHNFLTKELITQSDNSQIISHYNYASEVRASPPSGSSQEFLTALDSLMVKNRIEVPIEKLIYKNTSLLAGELTSYKNWNIGSKTLAYPENIKHRYLSGPYQIQDWFYKYDDHANVSEMGKNYAPRIGLKWDYNRQYLLAQCSNAMESEFFIEGFETNGATGSAHTGLKYYNGDYSVTWTLPNSRNYIISYWYRSGGNWLYKQLTFTGTATLTDGDAIDDVRIQPVDAHLTSYTYSPLIGVTSQTDAKGMTTYYEYDSFNRLQNIKDHNGNIVKNYAYNYAGSTAVTPVTSYQSQAKSQSFTKNNCPSGQSGTSVTYTVPAGKYSSTISPADADAKAQNEINLYGQQNANLLGGCSTGTTTYYSAALSVSRTKNNCPAGQNGSAVVFNAVLGAYTSTISQQDADQKALDAAQANANALGTCSAGTTTYQSAALSVTRTKNNCPAGQNGSAVAFNAVLGAYTSTISQQDADQKALDAAQANANSLGSCSIPGSYPNPEFVIYRTKNNCPAGLVSVASIPYTVPAGTYTSAISLDDAKIQAEAMMSSTAQTTANSLGTCANTQGTFTLNFVAPLTMHFEVIIKDPSGNIIAQPIFHGSHTVPNIPGGTGSITIQTWNSPSTPLTFNANLNGSVQTVLPAQFNNVSLTGTVNLTMVQTKFVNAVKIVSRTRNNCGAGYIGSAVNYTVAYGTHISYISQADADQLATNDINANAQAHANANGTCTVQPVYYNTARSITLQKSCSVGQVGSSVTYTVPAAKHSSIYSQADADQKALQDENANAQAYANSNGTCTIPTFTLNYSVPDFQQFTLTITNLGTNTPINYTISGTGSLSNIPGGASAFYVGVTLQSYISGIDYTFSFNSGQYSGTYFMVYPQLSGTMQLNVVTNQTVYKNVALSVSRTKNDCSSGQIGTAVTYSVAASKYMSLISQADANQKAQDEVDANAQNYANTNGTCQQIYYNTYLQVTKTRNNCTVGYIGGQAFYIVSNGKYSSMISQADADAKAQAEVDANAQNHANTYATCTPPVTYSNTYTYGLLKKNDCPPGQIGGTPVYYHVTAGKHTSTISQADANAKAQADIAANAQNYANANGTCIASTFSMSYNIPIGTQFQVRIVNYTNGTDVNYTTTGATGVFSNIPVGYVSISVKELNGTVGYYFLLNGQLQTEKVSEAVLSPYMSPTGLQTLYVTETNE